jgi:hypothetical protein
MINNVDPNVERGQENAPPVNRESKYYFLFIYGVYLGRLMQPFISKYPSLQQGVRRVQSFAISFCKGFLLTHLATAFFIIPFLLTIPLSWVRSYSLAQVLLNAGTDGGGAYLLEHLTKFYYLFFPPLIYFLITPLLWGAISFTLLPGFIQPEERKFEDYKTLQGGGLRRWGKYYFSRIFFFLCATLIAACFVDVAALHIATSAANEARVSLLKPLLEVTGVEVTPQDDPRSALIKVGQAVESLFEKYWELRVKWIPVSPDSPPSGK